MVDLTAVGVAGSRDVRTRSLRPLHVAGGGRLLDRSESGGSLSSPRSRADRADRGLELAGFARQAPDLTNAQTSRETAATFNRISARFLHGPTVRAGVYAGPNAKRSVYLEALAGLVDLAYRRLVVDAVMKSRAVIDGHLPRGQAEASL